MNSRLLLVLVVVLLVVVIGFEVYNTINRPRLAYVSLQEVFNGFDMKKEMETKLNKVKEERTKVLDSLTLNLTLLSKKIDSEKGKNKDDINEFSAKRQMLIERKKNYDEDNDALTQKYDKQILEQMSQYIKDYGKKNHYTMILGSDNNGNVMYAMETMNVTTEVLKFVNSKYKGVE